MIYLQPSPIQDFPKQGDAQIPWAFEIYGQRQFGQFVARSWS